VISVFEGNFVLDRVGLEHAESICSALWSKETSELKFVTASKAPRWANIFTTSSQSKQGVLWQYWLSFHTIPTPRWEQADT